MLPYLLDYSRPNMCGSYPGRAIDFASHIVSLASRIADRRRRSLAVLFADITAAYDSVVRSLLFGDPDAAFEQAHVPHALKEAFRSGHLSTWISTDGFAEVVRTFRGARAGDPWSDVVFVFLLVEYSYA